MTFSHSTNPSLLKRDRFIFAVSGSKQLYLDRYTHRDSTEKLSAKPVFIFLYEDNLTGDDQPHSLYSQLTENGYSLVTIHCQRDTRTMDSLAGKKDTIQLYLDALQEKAGDLYAATRYILDHAQNWNIDPGQVIIGGNSLTSTTWLRLVIPF